MRNVVDVMKESNVLGILNSMEHIVLRKMDAMGIGRNVSSDRRNRYVPSK